jgi:hypothetical protein
MLARGVLALFVCAGLMAPLSAQALEPGDATWHIGLVNLWGAGKNMDIYPTFESGKFARGLATGRRYNKSVHFIEAASLELKGNRVAGTLDILITPDQWVPRDGQPANLKVEIDGKLSPTGETHALGGTYKGTLGGQAVSGSLTGATGATETGWDDSVMMARLNQVPAEPGGLLPQVTLVVGVGAGKVHRGRIGVSYKGPAPQEYPFDTSGLKYDGAEVRGTVTIPARAVHVTADPADTCKVELGFVRVQGLCGGRARITTLRNGKPLGKPLEAYGRGSASKGGGKVDPKRLRPLWKYGVDTDPWWVPVKGFRAPAAGEHPRLLFRRGDLEALRAKAKTPQGKAILKRLRVLLNGSDGESMPKAVRGPNPPYGDKSKPINQPVGAYSMSHAAGFGLLWQVTGDRKYADLGRKCMELALKGCRDRDGKARYSFRKPSGPLRAGTALGWTAVGYDLCCDGWDPAYRGRIARELLSYDEGPKMSLESLVKGSIVPGSNHYGMQVGGGALALLAIANDPGVDMAKVTPLLAAAETSAVRLMRYGWGDGGFFGEGDGTGSMSAHIAFLPSLIAWRNAAGRDFITPRPHAQWMTLKWVLGTIVKSGRPNYISHGGYSHNTWARAGLSGAGYFAEGLGALPDKLVPGLLGYYEQFLAARDAAAGTPYDTVSLYPHIAVMSFVNWPVGVKAVNPAEVLPRTQVDRVFGYFVNRNRWQDADDTVITLLLNTGPEGYIRVKDAGRMTLRGSGVSATFKTGLGGAIPVYYKAEPDGSSVLSVAKGGKVSCVAVDFGRDVPAVIGVGPNFAGSKPRRGWPKGLAVSQVPAGGQTFTVITLGGAGPKVAAADGGIKVGPRSCRYDGVKLIVSD